MRGLKDIPPDKLVALRFVDAEGFKTAARIAAKHRIPVDAVGYKTLVVQHVSVPLFENAALKFDSEPIASPEKISAKEYGALRRDAVGL